MRIKGKRNGKDATLLHTADSFGTLSNHDADLLLQDRSKTCCAPPRSQSYAQAMSRAAVRCNFNCKDEMNVHGRGPVWSVYRTEAGKYQDAVCWDVIFVNLVDASWLAMSVGNPMPHSDGALLKIDQQGTRLMPGASEQWLHRAPVGLRTARRLEMAATSASGWLWQGMCPVTSCFGWKYRRWGLMTSRPGEVVRGECMTAGESPTMSSEKSTKRLVSKTVAAACSNFSACNHCKSVMLET